MALKLKDKLRVRAKENQSKAGTNFGKGKENEQLCQNSDKAIDTKKELAKAAGVSHDTVHKVETIREHGIDELRDKDSVRTWIQLSASAVMIRRRWMRLIRWLDKAKGFVMT
ncbi:MAG: hypothetical protein AB1847_22830 [bacterium]